MKDQYEGRTMFHKLCLLNSLINFKLKNGDYKGDLIAVLESRYARLSIFGSSRDDAMKVVILIATLRSHEIN